MHQRRGQRVARGDGSGAGANAAPAPAKPTRPPAMRSSLGVTDPPGNAAADRAVLAKTRGLGMLRVWLVVVSSMRLLSVYLGFRDVARFRTHMFANAPDQVTDLYGRTFATWTAVTCVLCLVTARALGTPGPSARGAYQCTIASFVAALAHFGLEWGVYGTMTLTTVASPALVAGLSTVWMILWYQRACSESYVPGV